jgi:hypothetical protein
MAAMIPSQPFKRGEIDQYSKSYELTISGISQQQAAN